MVLLLCQLYSTEKTTFLENIKKAETFVTNNFTTLCWTDKKNNIKNIGTKEVLVRK